MSLIYRILIGGARPRGRAPLMTVPRDRTARARPYSVVRHAPAHKPAVGRANAWSAAPARLGTLAPQAPRRGAATGGIKSSIDLNVRSLYQLLRATGRALPSTCSVHVFRPRVPSTCGRPACGRVPGKTQGGLPPSRCPESRCSIQGTCSQDPLRMMARAPI